jgi:hypothetical protein
VPHQGKVDVEYVLSVFAPSVEELVADLNQHFRISKASHRAICATMKFLWQVKAAIAAENADPPPRISITGVPNLLKLF